jgi:hypothetical protein
MPEDENDDTPEPEEDAAGSDAGSDDDGSGHDPLAVLTGKVDQLLSALGPDADNDDGETVTTPAQHHTTNADVEATAARAVREALAGQTKEKERDDRLAKVEKAIERQPIKQSKLSRAIWGKVDA